jgi:DNA (cytosine-5)-methyltransferase 1
VTTAGSLCTGILGAELALEMMGLDPDLLWYSEIDKDACKILAKRVPGVPNLGDLKLIEWERVEPVDVLTAGYPCQPFSTAGKRKGTDDPRHLWPWICDAIRVLRPRITLLENVGTHLSLGFDTVLSDLASIGFDARWTTFRAADVGACHARNRLFIVAYPSGDEPERWGADRNLVSSPSEGEREAPERQRVRDAPLCSGPAPADTHYRAGDGQRARPEPGERIEVAPDTNEGRCELGSNGGGGSMSYGVTLTDAAKTVGGFPTYREGQ